MIVIVPRKLGLNSGKWNNEFYRVYTLGQGGSSFQFFWGQVVEEN